MPAISLDELITFILIICITYTSVWLRHLAGHLLSRYSRQILFFCGISYCSTKYWFSKSQSDLAMALFLSGLLMDSRIAGVYPSIFVDGPLARLMSSKLE
jgi:hypothetical protein